MLRLDHTTRYTTKKKTDKSETANCKRRIWFGFKVTHLAKKKN